MLTEERPHFLFHQGRKSIFTFPACTTIVRWMASYHADMVLKGFHSTVLEGATQVHARAVPWQLAKGRIYAIQSRYMIELTPSHMSQTHCRCPRLSGKTVRAIVI